MAKKEYFDLEYFLTSTDAGLYNIAKEIFSYLDPWDLVQIGNLTKTFAEFTKNEKDYLWSKFEKRSMKIPKKSCGLIIGREGSQLDFIERAFSVSLKVNQYRKEPFTFTISLIGYSKSVDEASRFIEHFFLFYKGKRRKFGRFNQRACLKFAKGWEDSTGVFPEDFGFESLRLN